MKRKTVSHRNRKIEVYKTNRNPVICLTTDLETYWASTVMIGMPPHKLRAFGKACIQIADEVEHDR